MNRFTMWLVMATAWLAAASATAAPLLPVRASKSQGPISDALGLREMLPTTAPPLVIKVVMANEGTLELQHRTFKTFEVMEKVKQVQYREEKRTRIVKRAGQEVTEAYTVRVPVEIQFEVKKTVQVLDDKIRKESVAVKDCKFFTVTKEGKLEAVEAKAAAALLKKPTAILTGFSAEVDPRHLELVRPGTLFVVIPQPKPAPPPPPPPPKPEEKPKT